MKIVLFGMAYYNFTKSIKWALEKLGHKVLMFLDNDFDTVSNDLKDAKVKMLEFEPDVFINYCGNYRYNLIDNAFLHSISCKKVLMYADAIEFVGDVEQNIPCYDNVIVFEPSDKELIKKRYGKDSICISGSVAEEIYCKKQDVLNTVYDLSFVGVMTKERLDFFEEIARYVKKRKIKMIVYGHFWHDKHWWQNIISKYKFARKYPNLVGYAKNTFIKPEEAAFLYKQSKICLNKHIDRHQGMNCRTFEIMANNNFVLCDERVQADEFGLMDGKNIVFYKNVADCIQKIEYYLANVASREEIAVQGGFLVRERFTTRVVMKKILDEIMT